MSEDIRKLDARLVAVAKNIKVLSVLNWSPHLRETFLKSWERGNPTLPKVSYEIPDFSSQTGELKAVMSLCPLDHVLGRFLYRTAKSYLTVINMLSGVGNEDFSKNSQILYGNPEDQIIGSTETHCSAAKRFLQKTSVFEEAYRVTNNDICILPETVQLALQECCDITFGAGVVSVVLDPELSSKAAAGAERVRIRSSTSFSDEDIDQLREHEVLVHTLTSLNGRQQPLLQSLSLAAPRTTRTQEGIALFAELITFSMDLQRLRRVALRVLAVQMGLAGADFIEVFKFFLDNGQSEVESFQSAARVFRGGDVKGHIVFTKDLSYMAGLSEVLSFLRKAIQDELFDLPRYLFSGRLTLGDALEFVALFETEELALPTFEPSWLKHRPRLAAFLLYSGFLDTIDLEGIEINAFANKDSIE